MVLCRLFAHPSVHRLGIGAPLSSTLSKVRALAWHEGCLLTPQPPLGYKCGEASVVWSLPCCNLGHAPPGMGYYDGRLVAILLQSFLWDISGLPMHLL
jgi:hypothetical protein